jgi:hypothetical protein
MVVNQGIKGLSSQETEFLSMEASGRRFEDSGLESRYGLEPKNEMNELEFSSCSRKATKFLC